MSHTKQQQRNKGSSAIVSLFFGLAMLAVSLWLFFNKQYVLDYVSYQQYSPTSEIKSITERTTMTDDGTFLFYASRPEIQEPEAFNASCQRKEDSSAILGCYSNNRIYIFNVTSEQLDGIKEVTSAHEMLHAVYQRMGSDEKSKVNALLEKEYEKLRTNKELAERMAFYARTEAGERDNELHSIFGTEVAELDPRLEGHYAKYFKDRRTIAKLYATYAGVFDGLKAKAEALSEELKTLGALIESETRSYNSDVKQLNADIQMFNKRASSGDFTSRAVFDQERAALALRADQVSVAYSKINQDITRYESLRQQYNETAASSNELYKSIDSKSKLAPAPSV